MEVLSAYSRTSSVVVKATDLLSDPPVDRPVRRRPRRAKQVSKTDEAEIVARYQAGETLRQLAELHGITRQTVSNILQRNGSRGRYRLIEPAQLPELRARRETGESYAAIGRSIGVSGDTVQRALLTPDDAPAK